MFYLFKGRKRKRRHRERNFDGDGESESESDSDLDPEPAPLRDDVAKSGHTPMVEPISSDEVMTTTQQGGAESKAPDSNEKSKESEEKQSGMKMKVF